MAADSLQKQDQGTVAMLPGRLARRPPAGYEAV